MKNFLKSGGKLIRALANENRLQIVYTLIGNELSVTELGRIVDLSQSSLSQHLAILRKEKIVKTRRVAQTIFYSVKSEEAVKLMALLENMYSKHYKL